MKDTDGVATPLIQIEPERLGPIGSAFKLYVLAAVADEIANGTLSWDDTVRTSAATSSLPSGTLQDEPVGTEVSIRQAAQQMIEISDNTATDLLIERVGREKVESTVALLGHSSPQSMRPLLTTREMFQLSLGGSGDSAVATELRSLSEAWPSATEAERREILSRVDALPLELTTENAGAAMAATTTPGWMSGLEWFASPIDLAAALDALAGRAASMPELAEILGANPGSGLEFDRAAWPQIAFKGGSDVGVAAGSWRAVNADGSVLSVVLLLSGEDAAEIAAAQGELFGLVQDIFRLTANETPGR